MSYSDILKPRRDVLREEGIEGIIDLANLDDRRRRKLEARPADFFNLTYPTADTRRVVQTIHQRFSGDRDAPGLFLFEGLKGSGKSHLLVLVYHLFANRAAGQAWLDRHELACEVPADAVVIVVKFTDLPLYSIWDFVFERLTAKRPERMGVQPGLEDVRRALGDRKLILILDELEQGIRVIGDSAVRNQNIAFLQMLSEWGNRENQVTLFTSVYSDQEEPGSTLKRVPACRVRFEHGADKARVVLHRLFENSLDLPRETFRPVIESFLGTWRRHNAVRGAGLEAKVLDDFPFSPDLLEVLLDRIPARGGFQNVRGALGFLARLVKLTHAKGDLITPAHADLQDQEIGLRLADLDPTGDLIRKARHNLTELASYPLVQKIGSAAMLFTVSGTGRERGASREHLIRAVCGPGTDINEFERALVALQRYGSYFHAQEGRYFFDTEENPDARVEFRSLLVPEDRARDLVRRLWREELFREPESAVVFTGVEQAKAELEALSMGRLRFVLAPRRLRPEERHELYFGLNERNQVILLEPRDARFDASGNRDLIKWGQRVLAAEELIVTTQETPRKADYERIAREDRKLILDELRRGGLTYVRVEKYGAAVAEDEFAEERLGNAQTREEVVVKLSQEIFPVQLIAEHIGNRSVEVRGRTVRDVDRDYRTILGYPVPTHTSSVLKAIRELCHDGVIGIRHPRGNSSGQAAELNESELLNATIDAPFERPRPGQTTPPAGIAPTPPRPPGPQPLTAVPPPPLPGVETREIVVPSQPGAGALRQQVAARLEALPGAVVTKARFTIFLEISSGDLSTLPQAIRGSISGSGSLTAEITITTEDLSTKGEVEQFVERLPSLPGASYSARLEVQVTLPQEERAELA
jgi:hypothetical protein